MPMFVEPYDRTSSVEAVGAYQASLVEVLEPMEPLRWRLWSLSNLLCGGCRTYRTSSMKAVEPNKPVLWKLWSPSNLLGERWGAYRASSFIQYIHIPLGCSRGSDAVVLLALQMESRPYWLCSAELAYLERYQQMGNSVYFCHYEENVLPNVPSQKFQ